MSGRGEPDGLRKLRAEISTRIGQGLLEILEMETRWFITDRVKGKLSAPALSKMIQAELRAQIRGDLRKELKAAVQDEGERVADRVRSSMRKEIKNAVGEFLAERFGDYDDE